ncbi:uncharacterized protein LOC118510139 [Anopheles stephensi]|uniref:uncharacterized protein LOC118510139 n=1 Tax=Anopheles stephensi TaxID=30069 RepID=UPI0016589ABD|nr:uncharacterized protein LOC118510139 [Anopheles stephensi]
MRFMIRFVLSETIFSEVHGLIHEPKTLNFVMVNRSLDGATQHYAPLKYDPPAYAAASLRKTTQPTKRMLRLAATGLHAHQTSFNNPARHAFIKRQPDYSIAKYSSPNWPRLR